jgi:hypothetical protein
VASDRANAIASTVYAEGANVYVGYSPGWYLSTDAGVTFAQMELPESVEDVAAADGKVFAATADGIAISTDGFRSFTLRTTAHGLGDRDVDEVVALAGGRVYAVTSWGLSVSTDGGTSFTEPYTNFLNTPDCVAAEGSLVYVGVYSVLYESQNGGTSYTQVLPAVGDTNWLQNTKSVAVRGSTVVLGESYTVWISTDGGSSFTERGAAEGLGGSSLYVQDVAISGTGEIWVGTSIGAFVSRDSGVSFTRPAGFTTNVSVQGMTAEPGAPLYIGTWNGLGISIDGGATVTWRRTAEGIQGPRSSVYVP